MALLSNGPGAAVLAGTVTPDTFVGPPILVVGDGLTSAGDARFVAASGFCDTVGARFGKSLALVGIASDGGVTSTADLATLVAALKPFSKFFDVNQQNQFYWSNGGPVAAWPVLGPIFAMPNSGVSHQIFINAQFAWDTVSTSFVRVTANNPFGIGVMGCGGAPPEQQLSPPVYNFNLSDYAQKLKLLAKVWERGGPVTAANVAALQAAESATGRAGVSRRTHPALASYLYLQEPTG